MTTLTNVLVLQTVDTKHDNSICLYSNTLYAHYNSYDISFKHSNTQDVDDTWSKLLFLFEEFQRKSYEYILVLSNNAYIQDIRQSLAPLLNIRTKDILMYQNKDSNTINTNGFLVHNTALSCTFFQCVIDYVTQELPLFKTLPSWDSFAITYLYPNWTDVIQICPQSLFNLK